MSEIDEKDREAFMRALREAGSDTVICLPLAAEPKYDVQYIELADAAANAQSRVLLGLPVLGEQGSYGAAAAHRATLGREQALEDYRRQLNRFAMPLWAKGRPLTRYWRRRLEAERRRANHARRRGA